MVRAGEWPHDRKPGHEWLRQLNVSFVPGPGGRLAAEVREELMRSFGAMGHSVLPVPDDRTDVVVTTAEFGVPLDWREALLFTVRRRFDLERAPTIYTLVQAAPRELDARIDHLQSALSKAPPDPRDYSFPGLAEGAYQVLFEQGQRGGPILALERVVQSQAKCIDVLLIVGEDVPEEGYLFNLVGAHPRIPADDLQTFYRNIVERIVTAESTHEVTDHEPAGKSIPLDVWAGLETPKAMCEAGRQLGERDFFTETVRINDLVNVPAVARAVSSQYSEGCFSTWDPALNALITTVTGSARPVYKGGIGEEDLTVIQGLKPDGSGVRIRRVEGRVCAPPSSEAVEMVMMDDALPFITLSGRADGKVDVPVVRSKLHGHRGCRGYDPRVVEYVPMAAPYHHFPVTCATEAQAEGIADAFSRAESLQNPADPRHVVFTVLPGHGLVVIEKWVSGAAPFQVIWEAMDSGSLQIASLVPQGPIDYVLDDDGRAKLVAAQMRFG